MLWLPALVFVKTPMYLFSYPCLFITVSLHYLRYSIPGLSPQNIHQIKHNSQILFFFCWYFVDPPLIRRSLFYLLYILASLKNAMHNLVNTFSPIPSWGINVCSNYGRNGSDWPLTWRKWFWEKSHEVECCRQRCNNVDSPSILHTLRRTLQASPTFWSFTFAILILWRSMLVHIFSCEKKHLKGIFAFTHTHTHIHT